MIEVGQERVTPLGRVVVYSKHIGPSGRFNGRWWCDESWTYLRHLYTTSELEELPLAPAERRRKETTT